MVVVKPSLSIWMPRGQVTPSKRRRIKSRSRRRVRGRTSKKRRAVGIYKRLPIGGFKPHQVVRLKYSDVVSLDAGSGASGTAGYVFQANNIFDPDNTGAGHQPLYRDTWAGIYKSYVVLGAKIKSTYEVIRNISIINSTDVVTDTIPFTVGILLSDVNTDWPSSTNTLIELGSKRRCRFRVIPAMATNSFPSVKQFYSPKKYFGIKDTRDHLSDLGADQGSGPSKGLYFIVFVANADNSSNPISMAIRVEIEYLVMFYNLYENIAAS